VKTTPKLYGKEVWNPGCGRLAMSNVERYWWQSRHNMRSPPELIDVRAFAITLRRALSHQSHGAGSEPAPQR
jgi:hypothetical protein